MKRHFIILTALMAFLGLGSSVNGAIIVGRIALVEGNIYRYMDVDQSWVETFTDSPAGTEDILTTGDTSRAEISFPNDMLVQIDENTEIEIVNLEENQGIFVLQKGMARFYNQSTGGSLAVETFMGTAKAAAGSVMDIAVDDKTVGVAAVYGDATFLSHRNNVEKLELISGSTSLEFSAESIAAGTGPIDSNWDRWCRSRENVWSQNRLVRSAHLPETMQEYAHVLEPYGNWHRVYYRGYYYWAWQPRQVAVVWAPYTTGYWYDWHGAPVWIDHNSWGWVTHHYGHWIHMNGAWMWTPYVQVAYFPGVTTLGFHITFSKSYRPHWHPGRVRWIAHSSHIGWLPLAPWETYYGNRQWGPRSVSVHGKANFNITVNLTHHTYIDHVVIIPKEQLHRRGRGSRTGYSDVRVTNINKTTIINNYKPLPAADRLQYRGHTSTMAKSSRTESRFERRRGTDTARTQETVTVAKERRKAALDNQKNRMRQQVKMTEAPEQKIEKKNTGSLLLTRQTARKEKRQQKMLGFEQPGQAGKDEKRDTTRVNRRQAADSTAARANALTIKKQKRDKVSQQEEVKLSKRSRVWSQNKTVLDKQDGGAKIQNRQRVLERQRPGQPEVKRGRGRDDDARSRGYVGKETRKEAAQENLGTKPQRNTDPLHQSRPGQGQKQRPSLGFVSTSLNSRIPR